MCHGGEAVMRDTMGIIYSGETDASLKELTRSRSTAAVPFGGRYRIIDFILSGMVNSGIRNVGVITQNNYHSLMDHLESGSYWDLDRKKDGLFILPPYVSKGNTGWYKGSADALHNCIAYIRRSTQRYAVLAGGSMVCNITYDDVLNFHKEKNADITVIYKDMPQMDPKDLSRHTLIETDSSDRICDMVTKPSLPRSTKVIMEMYIIEKDLLEYLVEECASRGRTDFIKDILIDNLQDLRIYGYEFKGYVASIRTINAYFKHSMDLLDWDIRNDLFFKNGPIHTKVKDEVPAKYGVDAVAKNSLIADGCIVEGTIENCILFRGVRIAKGAVVRNSIIMQKCEVQEQALIENVILDKDVIVRRGKRLIGQDSYPIVIGKKIII
jgi:glucose-1-phosphate adenylyltransferase